MKHAFLIIAHNELDLLKELMRLLDHPDNFIYVHIDKKLGFFDPSLLTKNIQYSYCEIYSRFSVFWGDESQAQCELFLLKESMKKECSYFHFLSGADLPLKSTRYIHEFFNKNSGKEFIHFDRLHACDKAIDRVKYYHLWSKRLKRSRWAAVRKGLFILDDIFVAFQKAIKVKRDLPYQEIQKGSNWCSITRDFAKYVIDNEARIMDFLKFSLCGDEIFMQTLCVNSEFKTHLYKSNFDNDYRACLRLIIWSKDDINSPKTFDTSDEEQLKKSECLFARKFSLRYKKNFTDKWINYIDHLNREDKL